MKVLPYQGPRAEQVTQSRAGGLRLFQIKSLKSRNFGERNLRYQADERPQPSWTRRRYLSYPALEAASGVLYGWI